MKVFNIVFNASDEDIEKSQQIFFIKKYIKGITGQQAIDLVTQIRDGRTVRYKTEDGTDIEQIKNTKIFNIQIIEEIENPVNNVLKIKEIEADLLQKGAFGDIQAALQYCKLKYYNEFGD